MHRSKEIWKTSCGSFPWVGTHPSSYSQCLSRIYSNPVELHCRIWPQASIVFNAAHWFVDYFSTSRKRFLVKTHYRNILYTTTIALTNQKFIIYFVQYLIFITYNTVFTILRCWLFMHIELLLFYAFRVPIIKQR